MLIFEQSTPGRMAHSQLPEAEYPLVSDIPEAALRTSRPTLPEVSELQVVRHYTNLSRKNFSIDTHFYPLGSCTMKYNPRSVHRSSMLSGFVNRHPLALPSKSQGFMQCAFELQTLLQAVTGLPGVCLTPMAGAQGEFAGCAMIRAYHQANNDNARNEILIPDAAHGTNPASAIMCGFKVKEIPTGSNGDVDVEALKKVVGPQTAGIMLTNPSTLGIFDRNILHIAEIIHAAGALLYYDGANLNAILGKVRPGDMGFDIVHLNLHKTFATPHGGGGPGSGPIAVSERLIPFMPVPTVSKNETGYFWETKAHRPQSIGQLSTFMGNAGIILRAFAYARLLGKQGMVRVAEHATLNANYLMVKLAKAGFQLAYPKRRATHEFIITLLNLQKKYGVSAMDVAKRVLDFGFHAPTTYFPLLVPECLLIEPTETESKQTLDAFVEAMIRIKQEAENEPDKLRRAPFKTPVSRLDDVKAARELDLVWKAISPSL